MAATHVALLLLLLFLAAAQAAQLGGNGGTLGHALSQRQIVRQQVDSRLRNGGTLGHALSQRQIVRQQVDSRLRNGGTFGHTLSQRQSVRQQVDSRLRCSAIYRETVAADVASGRARPPLFAFPCELEQCGAQSVNSTLALLRASPRFASLFSMLPCDLWTVIKGRTLWLAGDSQSQRMYRTIRCFLRDFLEPGPQKAVWDVVLARDARVRRALHETLVRGFRGGGVELPVCTRFVGAARVCHARINRGPHMQAYLHSLALLGAWHADIWLFNVAMWYRANETGQYAADMAALAAACTPPRRGWPLLIWRDTAAQHFDAPHGESPLDGERLMGWNFSGCKPIQGVELLPDGTLAGTDGYIIRGGWRNQVATPLMQHAGVTILPVWNDSIPLHAGHTARECTHFCSHGAYNLWVWQLWQLLQRTELPPVGADQERLSSRASSWALAAESRVGAMQGAMRTSWLGSLQTGSASNLGAATAREKTTTARQPSVWSFRLAAVPAALALLAACKGRLRCRMPAGLVAHKAPPLWRVIAFSWGAAAARPRRQLLSWLAQRRQRLALRGQLL